jgi:hypothetical protein
LRVSGCIHQTKYRNKAFIRLCTVETWIINVHFHLKAWCVRAKYPSSNGRDNVIQPEFPQLFKVEHVQRLVWAGSFIEGGTVFSSNSEHFQFCCFAQLYIYIYALIVSGRL